MAKDLREPVGFEEGGHKQELCTNPDCDGSCPFCTLAVCSVCGCMEGSLLEYCPGKLVDADTQNAIYKGAVRNISDLGMLRAARKRAKAARIRDNIQRALDRQECGHSDPSGEAS